MLNQHDLRERLSRLDWQYGLDREAMRLQWQHMPRALYDTLPPDYQFQDAGEVMAYLGRLRTDVEDLEIGTTGEPRLWGNSPSEGDLDVVDQWPHGVGSGGGGGYTGGGSVQTGADQLGTTYGNPLPDVEDPGVSEQGRDAPQ